MVRVGWCCVRRLRWSGAVACAWLRQAPEPEVGEGGTKWTDRVARVEIVGPGWICGVRSMVSARTGVSLALWISAPRSVFPRAAAVHSSNRCQIVLRGTKLEAVVITMLRAGTPRSEVGVI
ncbi:hypothetical protein ASF49_20910 [Methylobacterium sp. Leaf104]|nr:hypothetical protein ASF49_20910 [Methylobacterium sp. Leaf104]